MAKGNKSPAEKGKRKDQQAVSKSAQDPVAAVAEATGYPPDTVETARRRAGWRLIRAAKIVQSVADSDLGTSAEEDLKFLTAKERAYVDKVVAVFESANVNLNKMAARLGVE